METETKELGKLKICSRLAQQRRRAARVRHKKSKEEIERRRKLRLEQKEERESTSRATREALDYALRCLDADIAAMRNQASIKEATLEILVNRRDTIEKLQARR
jgi:hypothetical protein